MSLLTPENTRDTPKITSKLPRFLQKIKNQLHNNNVNIPQKIVPVSQTEIQKYWNLEYVHKFTDYSGSLIIRDTNTSQELWKLSYRTQNDSIEICIIISYKEWTWTKLVQRLAKLSKIKWKNGVLIALANPFVVSDKQSYRKELTNLWFYYKQGFRAKDEKIHQEIKKYLDSGEEIPISLNVNVELIYNPN